MLPAIKTCDQLDELLRQIPMTLPSEDAGEYTRFTCAVWLRQAIRYMARNGFIACGDVTAAHKEITVYAQANDGAIMAGTGGLTYYISAYSK